MASAPWYLAQKPGLKHQKAWGPGEKDGGRWYERGVKTFQATKFRKGACENCGAMTHKRKDCVERPRKMGAAKTNKNIAADELVQDAIDDLGFDGKRDRYNGFDAADYSRVVERFEKAEKIKEEAAKKKELERVFNKDDKKAEKSGEKSEGAADSGAGAATEAADSDSSDLELDDAGAKVADADAQGFMKVNKRVRTAGGGASMTVRNLRIREDTAKYLRNLDLESAYYDPKSRSMRENPTPDEDPSEQFFAGDNVKRRTGDMIGFERLNSHAGEAFGQGQEIHVQAAPSQAELLYKQFKEKKEKLTKNTKRAVLEKYGNAAETAPLPEGLLMGQTESYVEYDRAGRVVRGTERATAKSRYEEDVLEQNHKAVWGSFWSGGRWGYACCRSLQKGSYCTGAKGIEAARDATELMRENLRARELAMDARKAEAEAAEARGEPAARNPFERKKDMWGEKEEGEDVRLDPTKLAEALRREDARLREGERDGGDERKRGFNVTHEEDVTEEEMEAFRMKRQRKEDPMAAKDAGTEGYDLV